MLKITVVGIDSVQSLSHVQLFATLWTAAHQASLSITNSQSLFKLMSIKPVMPSSVIPFSWLQSFPTSGSFPMSQFFTSGGQSIGVSASASVLPMNISTNFLWDWLVGSACSPTDFQESSPTPQLKSINSLALSFLYSPTLRVSLIAQLVKNPPAMQETLIQFLGQEDPLEKG